MYRSTLVPLSCAAVLLSPPLGAQTPGAVLKQQVFAAESTFAASFARRDTVKFSAMVAPDAIFFGRSSVMRGKTAVVDGWRPLFAEKAAPFSWKPEVIEVAESGNLAFSSGPVYDPEGRQFGTFNSIWRREPGGSWLIVFDKGCEVCNCQPKP
jgi:ketosteroid isomerase-like protein